MNELDDLHIALGQSHSGRARYGAAMALFQQGLLSAEQLECYRIAAADDGLDPAMLLKQRGLAVATKTVASPEALCRALVGEIDRYLGRFSGPGIGEVRAGIKRFRSAPYTAPQLMTNAVVAEHLAPAFAASAPSEPELTALMEANAPLLHWHGYDLYDRTAIGESFASSHAYCSLIGEDGAIRSTDFDLGLFLIAPHIVYRDHRHAAPELYAPVTGPHEWRFQPDVPLTAKPAHEPVWNEAHGPHLIKTGAVPFLCIFCWTGDTDKPAEIIPASDWAELELRK